MVIKTLINCEVPGKIKRGLFKTSNLVILIRRGGEVSV
jgi:hypothetical protein